MNSDIPLGEPVRGWTHAEVRGTRSTAAVSAARPAARYRPDIDGLRAIAVLAVVLTHADVAGFSGGFLGVDIFFVISGYLIHRDLVARVAQGRFSLAGFYGRRMRRTLPALYLVAAATLIGALVVLMPGDLDEMVRSLIGAVLLVPNIVFLTQTGYFDQDAVAKPLLHTWSLGVEEQFYLLAPLLPFALARLSANKRRAALIGGEAAALAVCVSIRMISPDAAFYLMPSRIFEFLIGAILAEGLCPAVPRAAGGFVAAAALAALALSITAFSPGTPHPGAMTLIPCLATAAIIHIGTTQRTWIGTALGLRGPAFVGLISYSLYLWHWPLIAFARYVDWPLTLGHLLLGAVLLLCLSVLSWRYVERPFRDPASAWRRRAPLVVPASAGVLVAVCLAIIALGGLPGRFPGEVASVSAYFSYRDQKPFREGLCFITSKNRLSDYDRAACLGMAPDKPNVLLIGDSHAAHLWTGLRDTWPSLHFLQATASGCKPVLGTEGATRCTAMMRDMFDRFIPTHHFDAIAIGALWEDEDVAPLVRTIAALKSHADRIVVFGPMPRYDEPLATLLAKALLHGDMASLPRHLRPTTRALDARMRAAVAPVATYVSTYSAMCPNGSCRLFAAPGVPMQFDGHHLTPAGGDVMMATIRAEDGPIFAGAPARTR